MPDNAGYVSGMEGSVLVQGTAFPFNEWSLDMSGSGRPDVTNWLTAPFSRVVAGIHRSVLKCSAPYKVGVVLANLANYTFRLGFYAGVYLQGDFIITLSFNNKTEDVPRIEINGMSVGPFTYFIV